MNFLKWEKNWGNNVDYRPLDYKYKTIFKFKRNWQKLIDCWDMKIKEIFLRGSILTIYHLFIENIITIFYFWARIWLRNNYILLKVTFKFYKLTKILTIISILIKKRHQQ
jgi:hypothetical protein